MYYVGRNGQQSGPFPLEQLQQMAASGELAATDLVWKEGMPNWEPAGSIPGLFAASPAVVSPAVVSPSSPPLVQASVLPPAGVQVPNYLVWAILSTVCCCIPLGIPAIVYSTQVNSKFAVGDVAGARAASEKAKMWCWIAFGTGLVLGIISIILNVLAAASQQH